MCGRYTLSTPGDLVAREFGLAAIPVLAPRFNIAPTQEVAIVRAGAAGTAELGFAHWGLVPGWAKERAIGSRLINARSETLADKPSFRDSFKRRRCLVVADGFYEWQQLDGGKQPWLFRLANGAPFGFAGLWSTWRDPGGAESAEPLVSCTIVTTAPNALLATVHDRMPAIVPPAHYADWLESAQHDTATLAALLAPCEAEAMRAFPVSRRVNSPAFDDPACAEPL